MNEKRFFGMLGFAMRAGKIILGTDAVVASMSGRPGKKALLVLICSEASDSTKAMLISKSEFYGINCMTVSTSPSRLGDLLGKTYAPVCCAITDAGFAREIAKALGDGE